MLGRGGFGQVFSGTLKSNGCQVAIKFLSASVIVVDENGGLVESKEEDNFYKECTSLLRVNSPYLIKFFGYGITSQGHGYVTSSPSVHSAVTVCDIVKLDARLPMLKRTNM